MFNRISQKFPQNFHGFWYINQKMGDFSIALILYNFSKSFPVVFFGISWYFPHQVSEFLCLLLLFSIFQNYKFKNSKI